MKAWKIVCKDLRLLLRDRNALLLLVGMPLAITGIVCYSASYFASNLRLESLRLVVVNHDGGPVAQRLVEALSDQDIQLRMVDNDRVARDIVQYSGWNAGVVIGPGFGEQVEGLELVEMFTLPRGRLARGLSQFDIEMISGEIRVIEAFVTSQFVFSKVVEIVYDRMLERFPVVQAYIQANSSRLSDQASGMVLASPAATILSSDRIYLLVVPSHAVLFAFFLVSIMARSFISERVRGTFQRLRMAPLSGPAIILGKVTPFLMVSIAQGILLFASGWAVFGMPMGQQPWMLLPVIVCTSLAATALGLLIAVTVGTDYQVSVFVTFLILVMAGISGCLMPREFMPPLMKQVSLFITPHAWSLVAYEELLMSATPDGSRVLLSCLLLLIFTFVYSALSLWRMARSDSNMAS